jgi:hypothetical protein
MNWRDPDADAVSGNALPEPDVAMGLFAGDTGELPLDTRRALAQLLAGPSLDGRRHSKLWLALVRDEAVIRKRLAELFLELEMGPDLQVAFLRQADVGDLDAPKLLRTTQLTFLDSVLVLYLRQCLTQADARGERAVAGMEEMLEHLKVYERAVNTDKAGFMKRCQNSIDKVKKHSILQKIRASEDRFEISPTLKLLFSAEAVQALTRLYEQMAAGDGAAATASANRDSAEEEVEA